MLNQTICEVKIRVGEEDPSTTASRSREFFTP